MNKMWIVSLLVTASLAAETAWAGSIWAKRNKDSRSLYTDDVARQIGDVLTIKVSEGSRIDNKAKRDLQKQTSQMSDFDGNVGLTLPGSGKGLKNIPGFTMDASSANSLQSKAD